MLNNQIMVETYDTKFCFVFDSVITCNYKVINKKRIACD